MSNIDDSMTGAEIDADRIRRHAGAQLDELALALHHITQLFIDLEPLGENTLREAAVVNATRALSGTSHPLETQWPREE